MSPRRQRQAASASVAYSTPEVAWYQANQSSGSTLTDSSGKGQTATLSGAYSFGSGISGNSLALNGGYASLPTGLMSSVTNFTIAEWVNLSTLANWSMIFSFGTGTTDYMFLTPDAAGTNLPRFGITTSGNGNEQRINSSIAIATNVWTNVAVTLSGTTATMYINGVVAGTNTSMTLNPSSLGVTNQNYLGKSQFSADPALFAIIEDVRIYQEALSATQIQSLQVSNPAPTATLAARASPSVVTGASTMLSALGADNAGQSNLIYTWSVTSVPSGASAPIIGDNGDNSAKVTVATFSQSGNYTFLVTITDPFGLKATTSISVTVDQTLTSVSVTPGNVSLASGAQKQFSATAYDQFGVAMVSQPAFTWSVASGGGSVGSSGLYTASATPGTATVSVSAGNATASANVSVEIPDVAWYTANEAVGSTTLTDSSGNGKTATLSGTYSFGQGIGGNGLDISGGGYASLPTGIVGTLSNFTIAAWVEMATPNWARVFDFGTGTTVYMLLTASAAGTNLPRFSITTSGNGNEQQINSSIAILAHTWTHVAVTLSGNTATLYINGVVAGTNTNMTLQPASLGSTTQNYIGKSQFSADPATQGEIDDFRIYSRALSQAEIQSLAVLNPAGYWKFSEGKGTTAADSSGNGNAATLGTGSTWVAGVVGGPGSANAVSFNGTSTALATIASPVVNTAASFTVSAWVELNTLGGYQTFVSNHGNTIAGYFLQVRGDTGDFAFVLPNADTDNAVTISDSGVQPVAGQWYQLTGVADASANTISIYVDGVLENTTSFSSWWTAGGNTLIGHGFYNGAATDYVSGSVDNVEIFSTALSATQVLGLHEAAAYNLSEGSGTTTADATGHGNTLTLGSGVSWTTAPLGANALAFNGTSTGIATNAAPVLNTATSFAVSAWVNLNSTATTQTFASDRRRQRGRLCIAIPQRYGPIRFHTAVGRQ